MIDWLVKIMEKRARKMFGDEIPIMWMGYKPEDEGKNVYTHMHPTIKMDDVLKEKFAEIAEYIRKEYPRV